MVKTRFITPPNYLKQKVGSGGLSVEIIAKAEQMIANHNIDFAPHAETFLQSIQATMERVKTSKFRTHDHVITMIHPVMQLKANGGMFGYPLITEVAQSALSFLENIHVLDDDAINIIHAHHNTLQSIMNSKIRGLAGETGFQLVKELTGVCNRYYKKHGIEPE